MKLSQKFPSLVRGGPWGYVRTLGVGILGFATAVCQAATAAQSFDKSLPAPPQGGYSLSNALGNLRFNQPLLTLAPPGDTNRLFVLERGGDVLLITNFYQPTKTPFLSLTSSVYTGSIEAGLMGMAFHPGYASNRQFFVFRTLITSTEGASNSLHWQVSRFLTDPENPNQALTNSEVVLIAQRDESDEHNAGDLQFGPDGYLYITMGDMGPPASDLVETKQPINKSFFAGVLRIDVDGRAGSLRPNPHPSSTTNYFIPPDNPFVGATAHLGLPVDPADVRTEYFAIGLRNPYRMSFDPLTGTLFCGDVGAGLFEEIDIITPGSNYGWPYYEAHLIWQMPPQDAVLNAPFLTYRHGNGNFEGNCVIGGVVARGNPIPELEGLYVFGDNVRGQIWAVPADDTSIVTNRTFVRLAADPGISAFGRDPRDNGILVVNFHDGQIKKLVYTPPEAELAFPQTLAATGVFADPVALEPAPGLVPYEIAVPFWSDNAIKRRWFALPDATAKFGFAAETQWNFPVGSLWVKHFDLELVPGNPESKRRLETRLLVKTSNSIYGVTYRWDDTQTNAVLVPDAGIDDSFAIVENGVTRTQIWHYPTRAECLACHNSGGGIALGFSTAQLNIDVPCPGGTTNQLLAFSQAGYIDVILTNTTTLPVLYHRTNVHQPASLRARSFLAANCSQCHQPGAGYTLSAIWDARPNTPLAETGILGRLLKPQAPDESAIWIRMASPDHSRMPPIGTAILDTNGLDLIRRWSLSIPDAPWQAVDIGAPHREIHASVENGTYVISGSGTGINGTNDSFSTLVRPMSGNSMFAAQLADFQFSHPDAAAGITFRESLASNSPQSSVTLTGNGQLSVRSRQATGGTTSSVELSASVELPWLRLVREGTSVLAHVSTDGTAWSLTGSNAVSMTNDIFAGLAVAAGHDAARAAATFTNLQYASVTLTSSAQNAVLTAPAEIPMSLEFEAHNATPVSVEFFANGTSLATISQEPFAFTWTTVPAGVHNLEARVTFSNGASLRTQPLPMTVILDDSFARFVGENRTMLGNWTNLASSVNAIIAGDSTNLPPDTRFWTSGATQQVWSATTSSTRALLRSNKTGRIAANWNSPTNFSFDLWLGDGELSRVSIYCLDWDGGNSRSELIEVVDPFTGAVLDARTVSGFTAGRYLTWTARGHIRMRFTRLAGASAVVSGVFLTPDSNTKPEVELTSPDDGFTFTLPASIPITASASDDGAIQRVEFFIDGSKFGESFTPPYSIPWNNALAGTHEIKARAYDDLGDFADSPAITITANLPTSEAALRSVDNTGMGDWIGRYGSEGFLIINETNALPGFANLEPVNSGAFSFEVVTDHPSALRRPADTNRIAACWYGDPFSIKLRLDDGRRHLVTLYFLDWLGGARVQQVDLVDLETGTLLTSETIADFAPGRYLTWAVEGQVEFRLTRLEGANAVVSGIFLDPDTNSRPTIALAQPQASGPLYAPSLYSFAATANDPEGIRKVQFFANGEIIGESTNAPYTQIWSLLSGPQEITAKAIDNQGAVQRSTSTTLNVALTNAGAEFAGTDTETSGSWQGLYGREAAVVFLAATNLSKSVVFSATNFFPFVADWGSPDPRAPQRPGNTTRIAAAIVADPEGQIDVVLRDGRYHQLALYAFDFSDNERSQLITVEDPATGDLLDTRTLAGFHDGKHLKWNVRGHVRLRTRSANEQNAVVQALFIDPVPGSYEAWRLNNFTPTAAADNNISGDTADPDHDGADNLFEYLRGTSPTQPDSMPAVATQIVDGRLQLKVTRRKAALYVSVVAEVSPDLTQWSSGSGLIHALPAVDRGETEELTFETVEPIAGSTMKFARLRLVRH